MTIGREDLLCIIHDHGKPGENAQIAELAMAYQSLLAERDALMVRAEDAEALSRQLAKHGAELEAELVKSKRECHEMAIKLGDDVARYMESAAVQSAKAEVERLKATAAMLRAEIERLTR